MTRKLTTFAFALLFFGVAWLSFSYVNFAHASEVTGTLSSGGVTATTTATTSGTIGGTVTDGSASGSISGTVTGGGGGSSSGGGGRGNSSGSGSSSGGSSGNNGGGGGAVLGESTSIPTFPNAGFEPTSLPGVIGAMALTTAIMSFLLYFGFRNREEELLEV